MLETLHIRNFALIDDLVLPWKAGLNVLTGETGAGKSIIIDAMSLLLGERASASWVRQGASSAEVEAVFDISRCSPVRDLLDSMEMDSSSDDVLMKRIINADGRSRCFLNGSVVTRSVLMQFGDMLVDMHGQHEHQSLMNAEKHLILLDDFAGLGADAALVRKGYHDLKQRISTLERVVARETSRTERVGELETELDLLDKADLKEGEDDEIAARRNLIANSEKIHRLTSEAYDMLFAGERFQPPLVNTWDEIFQIVKEVGRIDPSIERSLEAYDDVRFKLDELATTLQAYLSQLEYDPGELEALERRLETMSKLKRRHDCETLPALIELRDRLREEYNQLTGSSGERAKLEREVAQLRGEMGERAFLLSQKRADAGSQLERKVELQLRSLGMKRARFVVSITQECVPGGHVRYKGEDWRLSSNGVDKVEFLFSANVGEPPKPLRAIASGGEISRIMLAIRTILAQADKVPVIIFDEIDAGVGTRMGMTIAEKLSAVALSQQVVCVTHLPQIAAMADNHIVVDKMVQSGRTRIEVAYPRSQDRVREIARMLGGDATGKISVKHAQELLALARKGT